MLPELEVEWGKDGNCGSKCFQMGCVGLKGGVMYEMLVISNCSRAPVPGR